MHTNNQYIYIYFIRLYCQLRHNVLVNNARARTRRFLCVNPVTVRKITNLRLFNEIQEAFFVYIGRLETFKKNATLCICWQLELTLYLNNYYCSLRQWIINGFFNRTTISPYDSTHLSIPIHSQRISRNDFIINNIRRWIFPMPDLSKWAVTFAAQRSWQQVTKFPETFISLH